MEWDGEVQQRDLYKRLSKGRANARLWPEDVKW